MARTRRSFTEEFKREAVRLAEQPGNTVAKIAQDLGIDARSYAYGSVIDPTLLPRIRRTLRDQKPNSCCSVSKGNSPCRPVRHSIRIASAGMQQHGRISVGATKASGVSA